MNHMRQMRRSEPSPFGRWGDPEACLPRRPSQDVRVRRRRAPADFGACFGGNSSSRAHSQPSGNSAPSGQSSLLSGMTAEDQRTGRAGSVPPTGTSQSDEQALAKARAVASLQRLFFEEMAKGGHDANSAAAAALRRLTEGAGMAASSSTCELEATEVDSGSRCTASAPATPMVPRRPADTLGAEHRRRPAPMVTNWQKVQS